MLMLNSPHQGELKTGKENISVCLYTHTYVQAMFGWVFFFFQNEAKIVVSKSFYEKLSTGSILKFLIPHSSFNVELKV